jgi:hypothetical protein
VEKYPYKTAKLGRLYFPRVSEGKEFSEETKVWEDFKVDDSFFGGNILKIAELKDKPFYIIVGKDEKTLGIIHRFEDLVKYDKKDLQDCCDNQRISYTTKDTKQDLIEKLTLLQSK